MFTFINAWHLILEINQRRKFVNSKIGSDIQVRGLDKVNSVTVRVVIDVLQLFQDGQAMVTILLIICKSLDRIGNGFIDDIVTGNRVTEVNGDKFHFADAFDQLFVVVFFNHVASGVFLNQKPF